MGWSRERTMSNSDKSQSAETGTDPNLTDPNLSVHDSIQQQIMKLIDDSGLSDEEKQQILVGLQCPCCGAGGLSLSIKLKGPRSTPSF
jgi:hypothetical protein